MVNRIESFGVLEAEPEVGKSRAEALRRVHDDWFEHDPAAFYDSMMRSRHPDMLTKYSLEELAQFKLYKVVGYDMGFALKEHNGSFCEMVSLHNNEPEIRDVGRALVEAVIRAGGRFLDHFDSYKLTDLYSSMGFVEYARVPYDPAYDPDGKFFARYGALDVVYRERKEPDVHDSRK